MPSQRRGNRAPGHRSAGGRKRVGVKIRYVSEGGIVYVAENQ